MDKEFEILIGTQKVVLPFRGVREFKHSSVKSAKKEKNCLFLGKDFIYGFDEDFFTLKILIDGRELLAPSVLTDKESGVSFNFIDEKLLNFNEILSVSLDIVKENFPVIYKSDLDASKVFSQEECNKFLLPEFSKQGKAIAIYDLIKKEFVLMGENDFVKNYKIKKVFSNDRNSYLCVKNKSLYRFLVPINSPNIAYVRDEELKLVRYNSFFELESDGRVKILEHYERFNSFNPDRFDLPVALGELNFEGISRLDLMNFNQVGNVFINDCYSLKEAVHSFETGLEENVFNIIPLKIKERLFLKLNTAI